MRRDLRIHGTACDAGNVQAAEIIAAHPERYGGPESGLVRWARLVIERAQPTISGPLFDGSEADAAARLN